MKSRLASAFAAALLGSLAASAVRAASFVPMTDAALADQAAAIAVARVVAEIPAPDLDRPVTDYLVEIERQLKGDPLPSAIVVRVPGGLRSDGIGLRVFGAPRFAAGDRAILFLNPRPDGSYGILQLMLGSFRQELIEGQALAVQDLSEASPVAGGSRAARRSLGRPRDFDRFADWLGDRSIGLRRRADYFSRVSPGAEQALAQKFSFFEQGGNNLRWLDFDFGGAVTYKAHESGQLGLPGGGFVEFQRALAAWNAEPNTPINLVYGGTTNLTGGLKTFDSTNAILFGDPNQEIEGTFVCGSGGTLAYGGPWYSSGRTYSFNGRSFYAIGGGDVVTNDGVDCFFQRSGNASKAAEELFAHEVGHTLGMGHSSEQRGEQNSILREALMYYLVHDDGRGARLNSDDEAGIRTLYQAGYTGGSAGPGECPDPSRTLCLHNNRFRITLTWRNQFDNSSGVGFAVPSTDLAGFFHFGDAANVEIIVKVLDFGGTIKVFYSQLTNLRFTLTVTDSATGRSKTYQNTVGECGGLDNNFAAGASAAGEAALAEFATVADKAGSCVPSGSALCLLQNRFRIEMTWRNQYNNTSGTGGVRALTDYTGTLYFQDPSNVEIFAKMLDFGNKFLFFYGSLSDLEYTLRVTDTVSGKVKTYANPAGRVCGGIDENF